MRKQLPDGLILRSLSEGVLTDRERLPDFYAGINTEEDPEDIKEGLREWVRDLMNGHPNVTLDDIFVVVDPAKDDMLVSATLLIPQTWRYEGISIPVGRPELVATHKDYRNRGLVRALFDVVHERSASLGHQLQVITGIPHYYRKFGYTMAVDLGGHMSYVLDVLQPPAPGYKPAYTLRPAAFADIPDLMSFCDYFAPHSALTDLTSEAEWRYEIAGRRAGSVMNNSVQMIVDAEGRNIGFLMLVIARFDKWNLRCTSYIVGDQASYLATFEDVLRGVKAWALDFYGDIPAVLHFAGGMHEALNHLVRNADGGSLRPHEYAWYLRVPDSIAFFKSITTVLERHLEGSAAHRYTGELRIGSHDQKGIRFKFEKGCVTEISAISGKDGYDAVFPWNTFWDVVFGYRTYDDMRTIHADIYANPKAVVLLETLFPKKPSWLRELG